MSTAEIASRNTFFAQSKNWGDGLQEIWRTEYMPFMQKGPPVFEKLEEQIFRYAQIMTTRPRGRFVFTQLDDQPVYGHVDLVKQRKLASDDRAEFLERVYRKEPYRSRSAARQHLTDMEQKLREVVIEPEIESSTGPKRRRRRPPEGK